MLVFYAQDKKTGQTVCRLTEVAVRMWCTEKQQTFNSMWKASEVFKLMEPTVYFWRSHLCFRTQTEPDCVLDMDNLDPKQIKVQVV